MGCGIMQIRKRHYKPRGIRNEGRCNMFSDPFGCVIIRIKYLPKSATPALHQVKPLEQVSNDRIAPHRPYFP